LRLSDQSPASGLKRGAALAGEDVRTDALEAEREGRARCCAVEKRASVPRAVRAEARNLGSQSVVSHPGDRATDDGHAYELVTKDGAKGKQVAYHGLVMPVVLRDKIIRLVQLNPYVAQLAHRYAVGFRKPIGPQASHPPEIQKVTSSWRSLGVYGSNTLSHFSRRCPSRSMASSWLICWRPIVINVLTIKPALVRA
jgi:hypothetical protein